MGLKLIHVGLGGHGRGVARNIVVPSADFSFAGLVDKNPEALREAGEEFAVANANRYTDHELAFSELEADAVLIEAFSPAHYEIAKSALEQGFHVLIEKPFVLHLEEAKELVALAKANDRQIMINQNYRFNATVLTLKQALLQQPLGKPLFVESHFFCNHIGRAYQLALENYILLEMTVHHVDMIRFLLDTEITSVSGKTWNEPDSGYLGDPHVQAVYETNLGVPVFYLSSLIVQGIADPWEGVWRIQCEQGTIHLDDLGEGYGVYTVNAEKVITKLPLIPNKHEGIHGTLAEFAEAIRENRAPQPSGLDNLQTLAALFATADSSRLKRHVAIEDYFRN
ncbi:gfo/Idh/MocA family oxidoreductase [Paenibacillus psychroresistens]|uniref:Gfo/Idh/MocA family oxidoreductase n=1 Tax=Paenibacillus psychroresistens TaxID=1778678 RepID=A0A6B8RH72_9BACL|nr:Gfo/Idh/MocA family oxidoreductase [Paenibacillus psychroresistens]QGQ95074.1 gfo/Idh/MocA family oxidoreductase [Paenibacillus psychroresistens]